jgi:hypothetical protein
MDEKKPLRPLLLRRIGKNNQPASHALSQRKITKPGRAMPDLQEARVHHHRGYYSYAWGQHLYEFLKTWYTDFDFRPVVISLEALQCSSIHLAKQMFEGAGTYLRLEGWRILLNDEEYRRSKADLSEEEQAEWQGMIDVTNRLHYAKKAPTTLEISLNERAVRRRLTTSKVNRFLAALEFSGKCVNVPEVFTDADGNLCWDAMTQLFRWLSQPFIEKDKMFVYYQPLHPSIVFLIEGLCRNLDAKGMCLVHFQITPKPVLLLEKLHCYDTVETVYIATIFWQELIKTEFGRDKSLDNMVV